MFLLQYKNIFMALISDHQPLLLFQTFNNNVYCPIVEILLARRWNSFLIFPIVLTAEMVMWRMVISPSLSSSGVSLGWGMEGWTVCFFEYRVLLVFIQCSFVNTLYSTFLCFFHLWFYGFVVGTLSPCNVWGRVGTMCNMCVYTHTHFVYCSNITLV